MNTNEMGDFLGGKTSQFTERPNCLSKYTSKISRTQSFQSQQDNWKRWSNNNGAVFGIYCTLGITAGVLHKLIQFIQMTIFLGATVPPPHGRRRRQGWR